MLDYLKTWDGEIYVNDIHFNSVSDASNFDFKSISDSVCIKLCPKTKKLNLVDSDALKQYCITVKSYMTKKASPEFDFMSQWNQDVPMPLRTMIGTIEKETRGMYYMTLHGDTVGDIMQYCLKCGRPITNPVSRYFGMGPECGGHNYVNPFNSDAELKLAVDTYRKEVLQKITWSGWIIKSAITDMKEVKSA